MDRKRYLTATWLVAVPLAIAVHQWSVPVRDGLARNGDRGDEVVRNLDLPFNAVGDPSSEEDAPEFIVFYGQVYEADGFFFCLDRSLSMAEGEWQALRRELQRAIEELTVDAQFGLTFFAREVAAFPPNRKAAAATAPNKAAASRFLEGIRPEDWTCLLDGLRVCLEMADGAGVQRKAVIIMSDGKPICPGTDYVTYRDQILSEARTRNPHRIPIHAIGIGPDVDESFLRALASQSGGTYRRISK